MEDDRIKSLFNSFEPDLTSSFQFMERLKRNMEAVEIVKQHQLTLKRRNKLAVAVAAVCGFVTGVLMTLLWSWLGDFGSNLVLSVPQLSLDALTIDYRVFLWLLTAVVSVIMALNAYDIALTKIRTQYQ